MYNKYIYIINFIDVLIVADSCTVIIIIIIATKAINLKKLKGIMIATRRNQTD